MRWRESKRFLNPRTQLYELTQDPGESGPGQNREITRKLRGMAIRFQKEMKLDARPAGQLAP